VATVDHRGVGEVKFRSEDGREVDENDLRIMCEGYWMRFTKFADPVKQPIQAAWDVASALEPDPPWTDRPRA
jgi:hypothetical protein